MKAVLRFNLPEESEEFDDALNGWKYKSTLDEIWNDVFRPRHKHGYNNARLNELLEGKEANELMDLLEEIYKETVRDNE